MGLGGLLDPGMACWWLAGRLFVCLGLDQPQFSQSFPLVDPVSSDDLDGFDPLVL